MKTAKKLTALALSIALIASMGLSASAYWLPAYGVLDFSDPQRHYLTYDFLINGEYVVTGTSGLTDVHQGRRLLSTTGSLSVTFDNANLQSERSVLYMSRAREFNIGDDPAEVTVHIVGENYFTVVGDRDPIGIDTDVKVSIVGSGTLTLNVTDPGEYQYHTLNRQFREGTLTIAPTVTVICLNGLFEGASASPPPPPADPLDTAASWARTGITAAIEKGFVPSDIQDNYANTITRQEFARMAVNWVEYAAGKSIDDILTEQGKTRDPNAFSDTNDPAILAAYALGITSGAGAGIFNPDGDFTREQAATMIMNTVKVVGANTDNPPAADFADMDAASNWARNGINFVGTNGIMSGSGGNFNPSMTFDRQQSIVTFNNIIVANLP